MPATKITIIFIIIVMLAMAFCAAFEQASASEADYCVEIRKAVAMVGAKNIETFARSNGATDAQIAQGKACLHRNHSTRK